MARVYTLNNIHRLGIDTEDKLERLFKASAQEVISIAQTPIAQGGRMPVDTGFLRNSLKSGLNGSTSLSGASGYVLAIGRASLGDSVNAGWTAVYAPYQEYGARGRSGKGFMRGAAAQWQEIGTRIARQIR